MVSLRISVDLGWISAGFRFDYGLALDLILVGFGLILIGFGLIRLHFGWIRVGFCTFGYFIMIFVHSSFS